MATEVVLVLPVLRPAGAERIVAELARRLPSHGFPTSVVCLEDERATVGVELAEAGVRVQGLHLSRRLALTCARRRAAVLPRSRPLVVHAHLYHANLAARLAVTRLGEARAGVHVVSTIHVAERRFRPWQFWIDRATASLASCEVCVSRAAARFQEARTGLPGGFFRVIENGIDLARFRPAIPPLGAPRVVSIGRLDPQKDYPTLLAAWRRVEAEHATARLSIAGEGPARRRLERLARRLGLARLEFLGHVSDVPSLLASATLYVQLSAWEGFGLAVAEAMASRLPVVVSDADSLPEVVEDGRTGRVVPRRDSAAAATAILGLLADGPAAARLAEAAREEALRRFPVERMVAEYAELYRTLERPPP